MDSFRPPLRIPAPTEGRNSIVYPPLAPLQDTTNIFYIDNKTSDIESLNFLNDHSNYFTNVIQNADIAPADAATQSITLDNRSRWVGGLHTIMKTCAPNVTHFNSSAEVRVKTMQKHEDGKPPEYGWITLRIPEGNYTLNEVIDFLNAAVVDNYLSVGRQNGVKEEDIGVKFDTRLLNLGLDPITGLVTPGAYTYKAFHPDIILLPNCAVDFTRSRLSNMLGIRKRKPYQRGFVIEYDQLTKGEVPPLMDAVSKTAITHDSKNRSYHVIADPVDKTKQITEYRSWALSYHNFGKAYEDTLLTMPDITCGVGQMYWSLPDTFLPPITFANNVRSVNALPAVACQLFPLASKVIYNNSAVYSQLIEQVTNATSVFNRFPENQILMQPPFNTITWVSENVPSITDHGEQPLRHSITGVQRVTITDDRRRPCPYIVKSIARVQPRVSSSATLA